MERSFIDYISLAAVIFKFNFDRLDLASHIHLKPQIFVFSVNNAAQCTSIGTMLAYCKIFFWIILSLYRETVAKFSLYHLSEIKLP